MLSEDWPTLDVLRIRYIQRVLEHVQGNKSRAAVLLGIDRRTLNRILTRERARKARALAASAPTVRTSTVRTPSGAGPARRFQHHS